MYSGSNGTFDDEYIRRVLDTYSVMIIRLCYTYVKSMDDAEDMAQETFAELVKRKPVFENENHEKAWLLRTAINKCKNYLKSGWVRRTVPLDDDLSAEDDGINACIDGTAQAVMDAVMKLPEKYRTVIHLFYYSGMSINDIARVRRVSPATVGTQLARGRALLKKSLGGDPEL
ncbi:MAG: sigma-70 family RNA polymerase sigma factor [Huintestinicola sp.]